MAQGELKKLLTDLGLDEKEAQVFLSLSKLGSSPASRVAKDTSITRTHVYDLVEALERRGLVTETEMRGIKRFEAIDHAGLMAYLSRRQQEMRLLEKQLAQTAGIFSQLRAHELQRTRVRFFEGFNGMRTIYEEIRRDLETQQNIIELITLWPIEGLEKAYPGFYEKKIYINLPNLIKRDIMYESEGAYRYIERYKNGPAKHDYRFWPKEKGEFDTDTWCWLNKVVFTDVRGYPSGVIIENASFANTFRMLFNETWLHLPKSNQP